jgi:hypothetical protein
MIREVPVPRPSWVPLWGDIEAPTVTLPARGRAGYWIPKYGPSKHEQFAHRHISGSVLPDWEPGVESWGLSSDHFIELARALVNMHGRILLGREYNRSEKCNHRCVSAKLHKCTCSCLARNHGGGRWMAGWRIAAETTNRIDDREWSWVMFEKETK